MAKMKQIPKRALTWLVMLALVFNMLPEYVLADEDGGLVFAGNNCICGSICGGNSVDADCPACAEDYTQCAYDENIMNAENGITSGGSLVVQDQNTGDASTSGPALDVQDKNTEDAIAFEPALGAAIMPFGLVTNQLDFWNNQNDASGDGYTWNSSTKLLTLTNFDLTYNGEAVMLPGGSTIYLTGNNTITSTGSDKTALYIYGGGAYGLTIIGSGSLTATGGPGNEGGRGIYISGGSNTGLNLSGFTGLLTVNNGGNSHSAIGHKYNETEIQMTGNYQYKQSNSSTFPNNWTIGSSPFTGNNRYLMMTCLPTLSGNITGFAGAPLTGTQDVTVTLSDGTFASSLSGNWITNLPAGLSQSILRIDDKTAKISVSGTPTVGSTAEITATIPAAAYAASHAQTNAISGAGSVYSIGTPTYVLAWNGSPGSFAPLSYGYSSGSSVTYTVKNNGNQALTGISAEISSGGEYFEVSSPIADTLATNATTTVTVTSKTGLDVASAAYTGMLKITWTGGDGATGIEQSLSQTVNKGAALTLSHNINIISTKTAESSFDVTTISNYPANPGTTSFTLGTLTNSGNVLNGSPTLDTSTVSYKGNGQSSGTATQVVTMTSENYADSTINITFTAVDRTNADDKVSFNDDSATYTGLE